MGVETIFLLRTKNNVEIEIIGELIMLAAITKTAQIPFSSWLPAAGLLLPPSLSSLFNSGNCWDLSINSV